MSQNAFAERDEKFPQGEYPNRALTLSELKLLCEQLLQYGADPDREVLIYSDPEGNHLVSIDGWAGVAEAELVGVQIRFGDIAAVPLAATTSQQRVAWLRENLPNGHVVLTSYETHFWKE